MQVPSIKTFLSKEKKPLTAVIEYHPASVYIGNSAETAALPVQNTNLLPRVKYDCQSSPVRL